MNSPARPRHRTPSPLAALARTLLRLADARRRAEGQGVSTAERPPLRLVDDAEGQRPTKPTEVAS